MAKVNRKGYVMEAHLLSEHEHRPITQAQLEKCRRSTHIENAYRTFEDTSEFRRGLFPPHTTRVNPSKR